MIRALLAVGVTWACACSKQTPPRVTSKDIVVTPGDDLVARVAAAPVGATFRLKRGVHRISVPVVPKDGQRFIGDPGATVSGARPISFVREGDGWVSREAAPHFGVMTGLCEAGARCEEPLELFRDEVRLRRVLPESLGDDTWYLKENSRRLHLGHAPGTHRFEVAAVSVAFNGPARDVTIAGLTIERFASAAQQGVVDGTKSTAWTIEHNVIRDNHGVGIRVGNAMQVRANTITHNGQLGLGGVGDHIVIENNEIAFNNTAGYDSAWEAGGIKLARTRYASVRGNNVHDNAGPGIWFDVDASDSEIDANVVVNNAGAGILYEISQRATIENNVVRGNGSGFGRWLWGAGILISASSDVIVRRNNVSGNANAITAIQQQRGEGLYGARVLRDVLVRQNVIDVTTGMVGVAQDVGDDSVYMAGRIRFEANTYRVGANEMPFHWMNAPRTTDAWLAFGQDRESKFVAQ